MQYRLDFTVEYLKKVYIVDLSLKEEVVNGEHFCAWGENRRNVILVNFSYSCIKCHVYASSLLLTCLHLRLALWILLYIP